MAKIENSMAAEPIDPLLVLIARCPNVSRARTDVANPCHRVVSSQGLLPEEFQVPEPWSGELHRAPLLFLSSNPGFGVGSVYPTSSWTDTELHDYFEQRFGGAEPRIAGGIRSLLLDGTYGSAVRFWAAVQRRAVELYQREVVPGRDYVLSEVVHCKSRDESRGVGKAADECSDRYLVPMIRESAARVIVVLGDIAAGQVRRLFSLQDKRPSASMRIAERDRTFAFLPHPNARKEKTFGKCLAEDELAQLRQVLQQAAIRSPA
jgi:uracil-DNA glycosylase